MAETKSKFLTDLIEKKGPGPEEPKSYTSERQHGAQSFNLHVEKRGGRHAEGFGWSHYFRYKWTDEGTHERLVILMGMAGAVEIEGHNLGLLINDIRECKLNGVPEMLTSEIELMRANGDRGPIISSVKMYPDFEEILKEIKGEEEHETRFARQFKR